MYCKRGEEEEYKRRKADIQVEKTMAGQEKKNKQTNKHKYKQTNKQTIKQTNK
jgi:hypothetical protein